MTPVVEKVNLALDSDCDSVATAEIVNLAWNQSITLVDPFATFTWELDNDYRDMTKLIGDLDVLGSVTGPVGLRAGGGPVAVLSPAVGLLGLLGLFAGAGLAAAGLSFSVGGGEDPVSQESAPQRTSPESGSAVQDDSEQGQPAPPAADAVDSPDGEGGAEDEPINDAEPNDPQSSDPGTG